MIDAIRMIYSVQDIDIETRSEGKRTAYSNLDVKRALAMYRVEKSFGAVERALGVSRNTVRLWVKKYSLSDVADVLPKKRGLQKMRLKERRSLIMNTIKDSTMNTDDLAAQVDASNVTVRTDIKALIRSGKLKNVSVNPHAYLVCAA